VRRARAAADSGVIRPDAREPCDTSESITAGTERDSDMAQPSLSHGRRTSRSPVLGSIVVCETVATSMRVALIRTRLAQMGEAS
jgi:hypothetical protein